MSVHSHITRRVCPQSHSSACLSCHITRRVCPQSHNSACLSTHEQTGCRLVSEVLSHSLSVYAETTDRTAIHKDCFSYTVFAETHYTDKTGVSRIPRPVCPHNYAQPPGSVSGAEQLRVTFKSRNRYSHATTRGFKSAHTDSRCVRIRATAAPLMWNLLPSACTLGGAFN